MSSVPNQRTRTQKGSKIRVSCHASEGSKWHRELLAVSEDLQKQLQDPQFVATRCNLDGSGDLDPHELRQAARVYGIDPSSGDGSAELMIGQRMSKESFADMVALRSQGRPPIRTIPHSLRGMALGQLQHLETLFVTTGWLAAKCESFNMKNSRAIANGTKFKQGPNLYALDTLVVTPMTKPGVCEAREVDRQSTIAEAAGMSSFSELVNPFGLVVHCFVSHYWGHDFRSTVTALELWAAEHYQAMTSEKESLVFWICLFALNQHNAAAEVGQNPQQGPFNAALAQATAGAVMVLDEQINPFKRIWCLFEISRLKHLQRPFDLICSGGSLSQPETGQSRAASTEMLQATCEALWSVSTGTAQSSVASDKYQIWAEVLEERFKGAIDGLGARLFFESVIKKHGTDGLENMFIKFDRYMKSLLSTTMLQILLRRGEYRSAARSCLCGAQVSSEQVVEISNGFTQERERTTWLSSVLLHNLLAARRGHVDVCKLLLELGANVRAATQDGATALMAAAAGGHVDVAKLLLENGADVRPATEDGYTALMLAAQGGHMDVSKLLLENGAHVGTAAKTGITALMQAAQGGHVDVSKLLLENGAHVRTAAKKGITALMQAAQGGHVDVAKLLLENRADVRPTMEDGYTALMLAAQGGHVDVSKLLLENGAHVRTAAKDGATALMHAAKNGPVDVCKLLLEHGSDVWAATKEGYTALMAAAAGGQVDVAKLLLVNGADVQAARKDGATALMVAAFRGHVDVCKLLLENGADVKAARQEGTTALMVAAEVGHVDVCKLLLVNGANVQAARKDGATALMVAVFHGHVDVCKLVLENGADVQAARQEGTTALMVAAEVGHVDVCKLLLVNGADVQAARKDGATALIFAVFHGHVDVCKLLLQNGANAMAAKKDGATALMAAVFHGHVDVCKLLLENGADVQAAKQDGATALMAAAEFGHVDVAKLLLQQGADARAADQYGVTALMLARGEGHEAVARLLQQHG